MKKIIGLMLVLILGVSTVWGALSIQQEKQVQKMHDFLTQYGEELDAQFVDKSYMHDGLKTEREGLLLFLEQALDCTGDMCMTYEYDMIKAELMSYLETYLMMKNKMETLDAIDTETHEEAQKALLTLQQYLVDTATMGYDLDRPIHEEGTATIDLSAMFPFVGAIDATAKLEADSKYDLPKGQIDSRQDMNVEVTIDSPTDIPQTIQANGVVHVKMLDDMMYLSLEELNIDTDDEMMAQGMVTMIQSSLGDAYLEVPFTADMTQLGLNTLNGAGMRNSIYTDAQSMPMVNFYHQENPFTYYGVPSDAICKMLKKLGANQSDVTDCLQRVDMMMIDTEGKGIIVLKKEAGGYTLSLDDKYASDQMSIAPNFLRKPMLTRNNEKLQQIQVQLSEDYNDKILYQNNEFTVDYEDEEASIMMEANITKERIVGAGQIMMDDVSVTMTLDYHRSLKEKMNLTVIAEQNGIEILSMTMDVEGTVTYIDEFDMNKPDNTITLQELQSQMMEKAGGEGLYDDMIGENESIADELDERIQE